LYHNLKSMMELECIDGVLISNSNNIRYISGYGEKNAYALITLKKNYLLTDGRYTELAEKTCKGFEILNWQEEVSVNKEGKLKKIVNDIVNMEKIKRLGFEAEYTTYKEFTELYDMVDTEITPVVGMVEKLREIKSEEELKSMKTACQINDRVFKRLLKDIKIGVTEKELSALSKYYVSLEGGDEYKLDNIFLFGKRSSLISASPSNNKLEFGDFVLMNYGAGYNGYISDFTRTVVIGEATEKQRNIYNIVKNAEKNAVDAIKAGILANEPFHASAKVFSDENCLEYHYEGMGHGIGLHIHETPYLEKGSNVILEKNNVLTVEPGLYIPDWGGVRIEDMLVVKEGSSELLSHSPRDLIVI